MHSLTREEVERRLARGDRSALRGLPLIGLDLSGLNFSGWDLEEANFSYANLRGATFRGANLRRAHMIRSQLFEVVMDEAILVEVMALEVKCSLTIGPFDRLIDLGMRPSSFRKANLARSALGFARLNEVDFTGAILYEADISAASVYYAQLNDADMRVTDPLGASLKGSFYNRHTRWPEGFTPNQFGLIQSDS